MDVNENSAPLVPEILSDYEPPKSGRVRSGKARMEKLTPEARKELGQQAAIARWSRSNLIQIPENLPKADHTGELDILGSKLPCAVLSDEKRVFTQRGIFVALGRNKNPTTGHTNTIDGKPGFLSASNLNEFIPDDLRRSWEPVLFRLPKGSGGFRGNIAFGYDATILPKICHVFIDAKIAGKTTRQQEHIVEKCRHLIKGLSGVAIIALVDEATGYQRDREARTLQEILNRYIGSDLAKWAPRFLKFDFYEQMCRLKGLQYNPNSQRRPYVLARVTVDVIYDRIGPGLTEDLKKKKAEKIANGGKDHRLYHWLTGDIGLPALDTHLDRVTWLAKTFADGDWDGFHRALDRVAKPYNRTLLLDFPEEPMMISSASPQLS